MTPANTLTHETRPTTLVDGLEVEVFATEEEAVAAWNSVPSYVERQGAIHKSLDSHGQVGGTS